MNEAKLKPHDQDRTPGFFPILIFTAVASIFLSMFLSAYGGIGLALLTIVVAVVALENASRSAWNWVIGMATCGFIIGCMALLMKVIVMNAR